MKIRILDAAQQDLVSGFRFYDLQEAGLATSENLPPILVFSRQAGACIIEVRVKIVR